MPGRAPSLTITEKQEQVLQELKASPWMPPEVQQRASIILLAFERKRNQEISTLIGLHRNQVGLWRKRWRDSFEKLVQVECDSDRKALATAIAEVLQDRPRTGRPSSHNSV